MPKITKQHAEKIAKKLGAQIKTKRKAHDLALVFHVGKIVASFGIRRGSAKDLGHGHIPSDLHLRPRETVDLANCPMSKDQWLEKLREQGILPADSTDPNQTKPPPDEGPPPTEPPPASQETPPEKPL